MVDLLCLLCTLLTDDDGWVGMKASEWLSEWLIEWLSE